MSGQLRIRFFKSPAQSGLRLALDSSQIPGKTCMFLAVHTRSIILVALGGLVLLVFFKLAFDSQGSESVAVEEVDLEKARSEYRRSESKTASEPIVSSTSRKPARTVPKKTPAVTSKPAPLPVEDPPAEEPDESEPESRMDDANRLYDRANYEGARDAALAVLSAGLGGDAKNIARMKRVVVSSSCIMGDEAIASEHFSGLPARDQRQMARRCKRYGIEFDEQDQ